MKKIHLSSALLCALLFNITKICAQQSFVVAGGQYNGSGGSISESIGQVNNMSVENSTFKIHAGVQQPIEIFLSSLIPYKDSEYAITIFPNPTSTTLKVREEGKKSYTQTLLLKDANGKQIQMQSTTEMETSFDLSGYAFGIYTLEILDTQNHKIRTYKIIKQ